MKKALSLLLLTIFMYNLIGYTAVVYYSQKDLKRRIKENIFTFLKDSELEVFSINQSEPFPENFNFIDEHEFSFKGKLYDIVRQSTSDDTVFLYCINDENEEEIIEKYKEFIEDNLDELAEDKSELNCFKLINLEVQPDIAVLNLEKDESILFIKYSKELQYRYYDIPSPPPKLNTLNKTINAC